jgi:hypothetical protein
MKEGFDVWLETQLHGSLNRVLSSARPPALESLLERGAPPVSLFGRRLSTSTAAGLAAATLAVAGGGYAAASVANGSPNPVVWGQQVRQQVETCQDQRATGERGIGDCVSTFARQNGVEHRPQQHESVSAGARATGEGGQPGSSGHHGQPTPGGSGAPKAHPTPDDGHGGGDHGNSGSKSPKP